MKLSIITINYNNRDGLRKTLESVASQTFRDFEHIVIDGGSTDGSVEVIDQYSAIIAYWVSEPDKGIYNAMNKGVAAAHGEYTLFLNSGDYLCNENVLQDVFKLDFNEDIVCGNIITAAGGNGFAPEYVTMLTMLTGTLLHPASFIRRKLFDNYKYDERYQIAGDWDFFTYQLIKENVSYRPIDVFVTIFDITGISSKGSNANDSKLSEQMNESLLLPRVQQDYNIFMGKTDDYYKLFFTISQSKKRKFVYTLVVALLKLITFNRGWIKNYPLTPKKH